VGGEESIVEGVWGDDDDDVEEDEEERGLEASKAGTPWWRVECERAV